MSWERALEADARIAAKNSVLIRAALRQSIDFEAAFRGYQASNPDTTLSLPQQRVRARSWAIINIRVNLEAFKQIIYKLWAEAYVLGDVAASEAIEEAKLALKADTEGVVDWSKWKPGDEAAALILKPPRAFQRLLEAQGITWKAFSDTTLTDLGNAIGEAIKLGLDAKTAAKQITNHVANPARALTIAITEQNRAISQATVNRYREAGLTKMRWLTFYPCDICKQNNNVVTNIGQPFPSGHTQTPAHPNCRCALAPSVLSDDEIDTMPGATIITPPPAPAPVEVAAEVVEQVQSNVVSTNFVPGQWTKLSRIEIENRVIDSYLAANPRYSRSEMIDLIQQRRIKKADLALIQSGRIIKNGPIEVEFYSAGAKVTPAAEKKLLESIEELQKYMPKEKMTFIVASERGNAYGSAILGDAKIWMKPSVVMDNKPLKAELGFKMPSIGVVSHRDYTLAHEWGHTIDIGGSFARKESVQNPLTTLKIQRLKNQYKDNPLAFQSRYSDKNDKEFYAEMFAEFYLTKGQTKNPLVLAMAKEFKWNTPKVSRSGVISSITERDVSEAGYRGYHRAPSRLDDVGGPATDIETGLMPDFYERPNIYTTGMPQADKESVRIIQSIRNKPEAMVTIYRAVPKGVEQINPGDWVTLSPSYAKTHLLSNLEEGHVISMKVPAKDLWFDGNSINEFGYDPVKIDIKPYSVTRNAEIENELTEMRALLKGADDERLLNALVGRGSQGEIDNTDIYWPLKRKFESQGMGPRNAEYQTRGTLLRAAYYIENKQVLEDIDKQLANWAEEGYLQDVNAYKKNAEVAKTRILDAMAKGKITIAINKDALESVFKDKRFKNQFETKSSGGTLDPILRKIREKATFDIDLGVPVEERPIYGYITNNEKIPVRVSAVEKTAEQYWDNRLSLWNPDTEQYGLIKVVLKNSVRPRATVTIGDSLNRGILADNLNAPTPDLQNMGFGNYGAPAHTLGTPTASYLETQIFGGVSIDDIESIYVDIEGPYAAIKDMVAKSGLDIQVIPIKGVA